MKTFAFAAALIISISSVNGQKSIDMLFEKYSDHEGVTCITLSGNLLNFTANIEDEDDDKSIKAKITEVRILATKGNYSRAGNFHDIFTKDIDLRGYEEFLRIRESDQDLRVMVRSQGKRITEFLLIAGGDDNAIVQVKGNMSVSDAKRLCENARKSHSYDIF